MSTRVCACVALSVLVAGCADQTEATGPVDLRTAMGVQDVNPVGVAVDPTGARYVFDEYAGLYRVDGDAAELVLAVEALPQPAVAALQPFTDLVAMGEGRFAITAIGDGYLLDLASHTMNQYFCYEPSELPTDQRQRTNAVAYDAAADRLYAQPRTLDATGTLVRSQLAAYSGATGIDLDWHDLGDDIDAGGMAVVAGHGLVVGNGSKLYRYDPTASGDASLVELDDLARLGIGAIAGLAVEGDHLLVLDRDHDTLTPVALPAAH